MGNRKRHTCFRTLLLFAASMLVLQACSATPRPIVGTTESHATVTLPVKTAAVDKVPAATLSVSTATVTLSPIPASPVALTPIVSVPVATPTPAPIRFPSSTPSTPGTAPTSTCTYTWFFPDPPAECPGQPPLYSLTVAQHFEHGLMLWREHPDYYGSQIYVFFADNQWPHWNPSNDRWRPGMPESDPALVPPPGYYQPVRGFGLFWREAFFGTIEQSAGRSVSARDRLGWATDEEFSLGELPMQCHANDGYSPSCYLAGPDDAVYVIKPDNSWFVWEGPTT